MDRWSLILLLFISASKLLTSFGRSVPFQGELQDAVSNVAKHAIVFDAGSSKTKVEIYKINVASPPLDLTDIQQLDPSPSKVEPGIASLAGNPNGVAAYLTSLLISTINTIPKEAQRSTQVFFFATAGMRLLPPHQASAILAEVQKVLSDKCKCPFMFDSQNARILSGAFEGIYAWITVNFLKGHLVPSCPHQTSGILDLGGASHQNTFDNPTKDTFTITLGGQQYHLFARSYVGYGATEARKKYLEAILLNQRASNEISSPCHHKGYEEVITIGDQRVKVKGSALVPLCPSIIEETFFWKRPNCPFHDQPRLQGDFVGFSGIFYTALGTGMLCYKCTKSLSSAMFEVSSRNFCARRFQDVNSDPYAKVNCFQSNFVYELLAKGYRLPADKTIEVGKKIGGFSLGWSLGAMLYNGKYL